MDGDHVGGCAGDGRDLHGLDASANRQRRDGDAASQAPGQRAVDMGGTAVLSRCRGWGDGIAARVVELGAGSVCCTEPQAEVCGVCGHCGAVRGGWSRPRREFQARSRGLVAGN